MRERVASALSRFSSPICSVYSTATLWSIGPSALVHGSKMSVLTRALAFQVRGESKFFMSLLPRWLYEAIVRGRSPSARRYLPAQGVEVAASVEVKLW